MDTELDRKRIVSDIKKCAPKLWESINSIAERWLEPARDRVRSGDAPRGPKVINDPIWGTIELHPCEVVLLDSELLQRLRGVRQLGLAHLVFPGASHNRLEHTLGTLEAADRMIHWLERNAKHRGPEDMVPEVTERDRQTIRLAALLHDVGHGPFSHVFEPILEQKFTRELKLLEKCLAKSFDGAGKISPSELISVLFCLSGSMLELFCEDKFPLDHHKRSEILLAIVSRILGARPYLNASYLSSVISGPLDADKLDYMARDSFHAGIPIALDTARLISKLQVVVITPENAPRKEVDMIRRAMAAPNKRLYDVGIALPGISSFEQMIVSRAMLYDKLYFHHKVRTADAMARKLLVTAQEESPTDFDVRRFFQSFSDETIVAILGGQLSQAGMEWYPERSRDLSIALQNRRLYYRAFAFAARFIAGLERSAPAEQAEIRAQRWPVVNKKLADYSGVCDFELRIFEMANDVARIDPEFTELGKELRREHVLVDYPTKRVIQDGSRIFTRTEAGRIEEPSFFFGAEKWAEAYDERKRVGYVFCPKKFLPLVQVAAKICFFKEFQLVMNETADDFAKTKNELTEARIDLLRENGAIPAEMSRLIKKPREMMVCFLEDDFDVPGDWLSEKADVHGSLATDLNSALKEPLLLQDRRKVCLAFKYISRMLSSIAKSGTFCKHESLSESALQSKVRELLDAAGAIVSEGAEFGAGETDLILNETIVVENKVLKQLTDHPFQALPSAPLQARRYATSLCQRVIFTILAYRPKSERGHFRQTDSFVVRRIPGLDDGSVEIGFVIPYGYPSPSGAKPP